MKPNLLILGGTLEASALAHIIFKTNIKATISYAGRVDRPREQPIKKRIGGFGGVSGLISFLKSQKITHVIDATHPFASQMSLNAHLACARMDIPLLRLTRPPWTKNKNDRWQIVPDINSAVRALDQPPKRVMLAIGRIHVPLFYAQPQHHYLLRFIDPPKKTINLPSYGVEFSRGPFSETGDTDLLQRHKIQLIVSKNSGGNSAYSKIIAARKLNIEVIMIDRPVLPSREEVYDPQMAIKWLNQSLTERGV